MNVVPDNWDFQVYEIFKSYVFILLSYDWIVTKYLTLKLTINGIIIASQLPVYSFTIQIKHANYEKS